ncbi:MAG: stage III sporulation protein AF, partial [Lachnospiraceae bacterium]|nr:stage III sporulation protein AF [Lachnospiraceae bacterium]
DKKYAKYMKLIVGNLVVLPFLSPVYKIVSGMEADWGAQMSDMEQEFDAYGLSENLSNSYSASEAVTASLEREIKYRLNDYLSGIDSWKNHVVTNVIIELEKSDGNGESVAEYTIRRIKVVVWEHTEEAAGEENVSDADSTGGENNIERIEKIQVDKIGITGNGSKEKENETADNLRGMFCSVLGMEEKYMEVVVYGAH